MVERSYLQPILHYSFSVNRIIIAAVVTHTPYAGGQLTTARRMAPESCRYFGLVKADSGPISVSDQKPALTIGHLRQLFTLRLDCLDLLTRPLFGSIEAQLIR
jgi:hypothetical protein